VVSFNDIETSKEENKIIERLDSNSFIRSVNENFIPDTVIFVGNGAIKNGNLPLIECLKKTKELVDSFNINKLDDYIINNPISFLSFYVFILKAKKNIIIDYFEKIKKNNDNKEEVIDKIKKETDDLISLYKFKDTLSKYYLDFLKEDKISLTEGFLNYAKEEIYKPTTGVITTNWDILLWKNSKIKNIINLHGKCDIPESVVLPMEHVIDDYLLKVINLFCKDLEINISCLEKFINYFDELRVVHGNAKNWLQAANKIIIYGMSFNIYDSEIFSLFKLNNAENENNVTRDKEIFIINPIEFDRKKAELIFLSQYVKKLVHVVNGLEYELFN